MTNARSNFGFHTTTDDVLDGIDVTNRRILITGGTSGLGTESARALAAKGAEVIITGRSPDKAEQVAANIRRTTGNERVSGATLKLESLQAVRDAAAAIQDRYDALDVLINNAGVMACPHEQTSDGFERQFGVNHLGHFVFTGLLVPTLLRAAAPRVVNLSSLAHRMASVDLDDPNFKRRSYDKWIAYGQSKTANILFTVELDRRLRDHGARAYAVHPGAIVTELGRHMSEAEVAHVLSQADTGEMKFKSVEAGAATQVYAATAPELASLGGVYLEDCRIAERNDTEDSVGVRSYALDPTTAATLWEVSETLVGQAFAW